MKILITKRNIIITPAPRKNKVNGLKIYFWREPKPVDCILPVATTDLVKGKRKYYLPAKDFRYAIKGIEF